MHALHGTQSLWLMATMFPDWRDVTDDRVGGAGQRALLGVCRALAGSSCLCRVALNSSLPPVCQESVKTSWKWILGERCLRSLLSKKQPLVLLYLDSEQVEKKTRNKTDQDQHISYYDESQSEDRAPNGRRAC